MKSLSNQKMVSLSHQWTVDRRSELQLIPQVAGILPDIEAAHQRLLRIIESPVPAEDPTEALSKLIRIKDKRHDNFLRAGYYHLGALLALALAEEDIDTENTISALRKLLYPKDLNGTTIGYDEQEGTAILLENHLSDSIKKQLDGITLGVGSQAQTLLSLVLAQIASAKEIMALVRQRSATSGGSATTPSEERDARNAWIEATRIFASNLRLAVRSGKSSEALAISLLRELTEAEAEERRERAKKKETPPAAS